MEKVIPKSKTELLQNFFWTFRLEEAFVNSSMIMLYVNKTALQETLSAESL